MKRKLAIILVLTIALSLLISFNVNIFAVDDTDEEIYPFIDDPEELSTFIDGFSYTVNPDGNTCTITGYNLKVYTNIIPAQIDGYTVTAIGDGAFKNCSKLVGDIKFPDTIAMVGREAFSHCGSITGLNFKKNIVYIGDSSFHSCYELKNVTGLENVEYIGTEAFKECVELKGEITLNKVIEMGSKIFTNTSIEKITINTKNAPQIQKDTFSGIASKVYIPRTGNGYTGTQWSGVKTDGILLGDLDQNGVINGTDASLILDIYNNSLQVTSKEIQKGDMDHNGVLNGTDASMILDLYNSGL